MLFLFSLKAGKNRPRKLTYLDEHGPVFTGLAQYRQVRVLFDVHMRQQTNLKYYDPKLLYFSKAENKPFFISEVNSRNSVTENNDCKRKTSHGPEIHPRIWHRISYIVMSTVFKIFFTRCCLKRAKNKFVLQLKQEKSL